jgi:Holliday junction resolvase
VLTGKESKRIRRKGYCAERQLVKELRRCGFESVRVPVSAPSNEPLPDVFAMKDETLLAFEVKAPNSEKAYFRREQVEKLFEFLDMFKVYKRKLAIIAGKFPYKWVFKRIEKPDDYVLQKEERSNISFSD